jgi:hypothetical protein
MLKNNKKSLIGKIAASQKLRRKVAIAIDGLHFVPTPQ